MNFDTLVSLIGRFPWFDLATLVQLTDARRATLLNQLSRFCKAGKVIPLRRGMYVLAERYRQTRTTPAALAGAIYRPSYLSGVWALSYYGLIPESVSVFTSVTTRSPKRFANALGEYVYRNVQQALFFGFSNVELAGGKVLLASPEKALVDHWHLEPGEWTMDRMREMRFGGADIVDRDGLESTVRQAGKPRLMRALEAWKLAIGEQAEGEESL